MISGFFTWFLYALLTLQGDPYVLYWHSRGALCALLTLPRALCALLTLPGSPMCFIDTRRGPYVLFHRMFFDRYQIHIQDLELFTGIFIIFPCPSSQNLINMRYSKVSKNEIETKNGTWTFNKSICSFPDFQNMIFSEMCPTFPIFLDF